MTDSSSARNRGVSAGATIWLVAAAVALAAFLGLGGSASAHEADLVGATRAHAAADGIVGMSKVQRRVAAAQRKRRAALKKRNRALIKRGYKLLTDQQIREGVLLQSLGYSIDLSPARTVGVASASGDIAIDGTGQKLSAPTGYALMGGGVTADDVDLSQRGVKGEWSDPVQPNYPTYGPNQSPATGFPNPQYPQGTFPGDPIKNTAIDYDADAAAPNADTPNSRYWSPNPRIIPIFEAMLPNGKVLYWDWYFSGNMMDPDQSVNGKQGTRVLLWDPAHPNDPGVRKDVPGANLFCAGYSQLPNGDLFLAGGNANANLDGLKTTFVYHWRTGTWDASQLMTRLRWYPSVTATWSGESMIIGGDPPDEGGNNVQDGDSVPEVFTSNYTNPLTTQNWDPNSPADKIRVLGTLHTPYYASPHVPGWRLYPFTFPWVDGRVLYAGRETSILTVDGRKHGPAEADNNALTTYDPAADTDESDDGGDRYVAERADGTRGITRTYGTGAYYGLGKVLVTAGDVDRTYNFNVPNALRGPGWGTYNAATDNPVDGTYDPDTQVAVPANANWVCLGYANGNPYTYSGNPYAANAATQWSGDAELVHVWNTAWCAGTNTPANNVDNLSVNGASKEAALIGMQSGEGSIFGSPTSKGWPTTSQSQSMNYPRRMANLTVLPTGKLVASGGMGTTNAADDDVTASENYGAVPGEANNAKSTYAMNGNDANVNSQLVNYKRAVFASEQWDPDTQTWTVMASAHRPRQYHSTTILLPDGRLMSGGGGVCSTCTTALYSESNFEFYKPPYFFWSDGSEKAADERPQITGPFVTDGVGSESTQVLPQVDYEGSETVNYTKAKNEARNGDVNVTKAALVKLGDPTHGFDQGQRYVPVDITSDNGSSLTFKAPPNPFEAPPGFYWLFLIDANGTPSIAKPVQIGASLALQNKLRTATAYSERNLSDPYPGENGSGQDFGLGSYYASHGNLADVRDNAMSSIKIDSGFYAKICRGDQLTDCATVPAGSYNQLGTAFEDHVSSLQIKQGTAPVDETAKLTALLFDTTGPVITISSPANNFETTGTSIAVNYTVTDNVSETDSPDDAISCDQPSGHVFSLNPGTNSISITCHDDHGNYSTQSVTVKRTGETGLPPAITINSPADGSTTTTGSIPLNFAAEDDSGIPVTNCNWNSSFNGGPSTATSNVAPGGSATVSTPGFGPYTVAVTCWDSAAPTTHSATKTSTFTKVDVQAPTVTINSPANGAVITAASVNVVFTASDNNSVTSCTRTSGDPFPTPIAQVYEIKVECTDPAGNTGTATINVTSKKEQGVAPVVNVSSPADGTFDAATVPLVYTVDDESGVAPSCTKTSTAAPTPSAALSGQSIALNFGVNTITLVCTDGFPKSTTVTRTVTRHDVTAPWITIDAPADNSTVTSSPVTVDYRTGDDAPGDVTCTQPSGAQVPLLVGANVITIACHDAVGNTVVGVIHVAYVPGGSTGGDDSGTYAKATVPKSLKLSKKLKFKTRCSERCSITIGVTGGGISYWPKAAVLNGSSRVQTVTFRIARRDYSALASALKKRKKLKLGVWIDDKRQGYAKLKR